MVARRFRVTLWLAPLALAVCLVVLHSLWLRGLGYYLVRSDQPVAADMIVVLAGDDTGNRILKAAQLAHAGYAHRILVSGPACCYGAHESDLAIPFAVGHGYPAEWFIAFPIQGKSTREEAVEIVAELRRCNVRRFLVVTSDYHTRRATRAYARLVPRASFRVVAAPDQYFQPQDWWRSREGRKQAFFEWSKTVADWFGF